MLQDRMRWFETHPRRTRNTFIMHCVSGSATVLRNMERYELSADMEWTLLPESVIQIERSSPDFEVRYCVCSPQLFDEVAHALPTRFFDFLSQSPPHRLQDDLDRRANRLYFDMLQLFYDDESNVCRHRLVVNTLQNHFMSIYDKERSNLVDVQKHFTYAGDKLVKRFYNLLLTHYREHQRVAWYAGQLCVSRRYLAQVFKTLSGTSPKKAIDDFLILEIKIELRSTHDSVQQIADRLHFSDQSVMGRFFKAHTGVSPLAYRLAEQ